MIIVHDIFICKPGQASKLAKMFKDVMENEPEFMNIMTDMTGEFNKVVVVSQFVSLSAYEKSWEKYMRGSPEAKSMNEKMAGYHDMFSTGRREIYQVK